MIAYVTSIGEPTTALCKWSLERNGFDVVMLDDPNQTLATKLEFIYGAAKADFIRVDADVIPNKYCTERLIRNEADKFPDAWWIQFTTYDWFQQFTTTGGIQFIKKEAMGTLPPDSKETVRKRMLYKR